MTATYDLDHTSFAVHDAMNLARQLRRRLGAVPIGGEVLPDFRYLLLYVGSADEGARLELLEPVSSTGFLSRFLSTCGEGPHHITVTVPDLRAAVSRVRSLGLRVTGESYGHSPWREAFIMPDAIHGTVIQLAQSDRSYPSPRDLLASCAREPQNFPSSEGGTDPLWWRSLWETPLGGAAARLGTTHLGSTDEALSRRLFVEVLGGELTERDGSLQIAWPSGSLCVHPTDRPAVIGMSLVGGPSEGIPIGSSYLGSHQ